MIVIHDWKRQKVEEILRNRRRKKPQQLDKGRLLRDSRDYVLCAGMWGFSPIFFLSILPKPLHISSHAPAVMAEWFLFASLQDSSKRSYFRPIHWQNRGFWLATPPWLFISRTRWTELQTSELLGYRQNKKGPFCQPITLHLKWSEPLQLTVWTP